MARHPGLRRGGRPHVRFGYWIFR